MRCVGYRQVWERLEGRLPQKELLERGIYATRQFAKRQLTWLRSMRAIETMDPLEKGSDAQILRRVEAFLQTAIS